MSGQASGGRRGRLPELKNVASAAGALFSVLAGAGRKQEIIFRLISIIARDAVFAPECVQLRQSCW